MNRPKLLLYILVAVSASLVIGLIALGGKVQEELPAFEEELEEAVSDSRNVLYQYGSVTMHVGERVQFRDLSLEVSDIVEESRCPLGVACIQAGTVRAVIVIGSGLGTSTNTLALGEFITTEAEVVTFEDAFPYPVASEQILPGAYTLTFSVEKRVDVLPEPEDLPIPDISIVPQQGACYVGGCSSQLCTDSPDIASTCEYREEYACYQNAVCERQSTGECGWTESAALNACLQAATMSVQ